MPSWGTRKPATPRCEAQPPAFPHGPTTRKPCSRFAATLVEVFQALYFRVVHRDDEFAANLMGHVVVATERDHLLHTLDRHSCLDRPGLVVKPRVEHAAVVASLVLADFCLFFQNGDEGTGKLSAQFGAPFQAHDATADNDDALSAHKICRKTRITTWKKPSAWPRRKCRR